MVVALPAVELAAILAAAILAALVTVAAIVLTPIFRWIGNQIPVVGGWASSQLIDGINYVRGELNQALDASIHALVVTIGAIAQAVEGLATEALSAITWTVTGLDHLATAGIHAIVAAMLAGLIHALHLLEHAEAALAHFTHTEVNRLSTEAAQVAHTVYGDVLPEVKALENTVIPALRAGEAAIQHELGQVISPELARLAAQLAGVTATAAALEVALSELGALRCSNVGTLARFLCGLDPALLNMLLSLAGDALILELLAKAGVSVSDPFSWAGTALGDLETIATTF